MSQTRTQNHEGNDYSVKFGQGSVVIQLADASNSELEKAADKIMNMIQRKQQLRQMSSRR